MAQSIGRFKRRQNTEEPNEAKNPISRRSHLMIAVEGKPSETTFQPIQLMTLNPSTYNKFKQLFNLHVRDSKNRLPRDYVNYAA